MSALLALALLGCGDAPLPAGGDRPDVVLISIDTLRADHLGSYGYTTHETSPFLDALAADGARFANARSPSPWTLPTHTTMLSGLSPHEHLVVDDEARLSGSMPLLQSRMREAGYATVGAVSTLYVSRKFGFDRGFDAFEDFDLETEKQNLSGSVDAEDVIDRALEMVAEVGADKPVFLFVHLYDVHYSYDPPFPWNRRFDRLPRRGDPKYRSYAYFKKNPITDDAQIAHQIAQYDEEIRYVDAQLEALKAAFDDAGREVIFAVTADHGEEFFERESWGHAHTLYPEQLHVPLIVSGPGIPAGVVVEGAAATKDIAPTIAGLGGAIGLGSGLDLRPWMDGAAPIPSRDLLCDTSRFDTNRIGVYRDGLRLDWDLKADAVELYADPLELEDVAAERPEDVAAMKRAITGALGAPWTLERGRLRTGGAPLADGEKLARPVRAGPEPTSMAIIPVDAEVRVDGAGPWSAAGGELPGGDAPLRYSGPASERVELTEAERERLRALGYVQ